MALRWKLMTGSFHGGMQTHVADCGPFMATTQCRRDAPQGACEWRIEIGSVSTIHEMGKAPTLEDGRNAVTLALISAINQMRKDLTEKP